MEHHTHQTAPTQHIEVGDVRFSYRRFGKREGVPLVFLMHFTGTMDYWDPAVTDGFAKSRDVILFNNVGVGSSTVPDTMEQMARDAVSFIKALGVRKVDILGLSIGGFVAQSLALQDPDVCRRLVLAGTGPRGREGMASERRSVRNIFRPLRCA
ncbi:alpha/beta hydrolase [uncultured Paraburkholderia sp.]|uniref:alpha/beta fold hydrolase n=1 Tax=uncultured Paraburkholderia sp. TaxID=1822466 RepID=UPI0025927306|nr:alpha/beta hydrolase [uncultured Paraburkholderia sp.]